MGQKEAVEIRNSIRPRSPCCAGSFDVLELVPLTVRISSLKKVSQQTVLNEKSAFINMESKYPSNSSCKKPANMMLLMKRLKGIKLFCFHFDINYHSHGVVFKNFTSIQGEIDGRSFMNDVAE